MAQGAPLWRAWSFDPLLGLVCSDLDSIASAQLGAIPCAVSRHTRDAARDTPDASRLMALNFRYPVTKKAPKGFRFPTQPPAILHDQTIPASSDRPSATVQALSSTR